MEKEFSLKEEINKLEDSPRRDLNIIAMFLLKKRPNIKSKGQLSILIKRHLRAAKNLAEFDDIQILEAVDLVNRAPIWSDRWTIETLVKILTK